MREKDQNDLGSGFETIARLYGDHVLKMARYPGFNRTDTIFGRLMETRRLNDLELIEQYFGPDLVENTAVSEKMHYWFIEQPNYGNRILSSVSPEIAQLEPQIYQIFEKNDQLIHKTGYTLDFFGIDFWKDVWHYREDPSYWSMRSFRILEKVNGPELRLADIGLLWTRLYPPPQIHFVNIHESISGSTTANYLLPFVKRRMQFNNIHV